MPEPATPARTSAPPAAVPAPPPLPAVNQFKASSAELRARLEQTETRLHHHVAGLRSEMTLADVRVGGRPVLDHVRRQPILAAATVLGAGALTGVLWGLARREQPEIDTHEQWWEAYHQDFLDDAAHRVRRGDDPERALRQALRRRAPVVVIETGSEETDAARNKALVSVVASVANTVLGFAIKLAMDRLAEKVTGTPEIIKAVDEADEAPPPARPSVVTYG
jgi:hypothetical protein